MPNYVTTGGSNGPLAAGESVATFGEVISANAGVSTVGSAPAITPTFASGTAAQLADTTRDYQVYFAIATGGGTVSLSIGPTSTPANAIMTTATGVNGALISVRLPAGWFLKITLVTSTIGSQVAIGC